MSKVMELVGKIPGKVLIVLVIVMGVAFIGLMIWNFTH